MKDLIDEHHTNHCEVVNSRRMDPRIYEMDDIVSAHISVHSDAHCGQVGKLKYPAIGSWYVITNLDGGSYYINHCLDESQPDKEHMSHSSVYPGQLVPFEPVDGPDNRFCQINVPIGKTAFA